MTGDRRELFKKGLDMNDGRRRREETSIQIRKNKKEDKLMKRRQQFASSETSIVEYNNNNSNADSNYVYTNIDIPRLINILTLGSQMNDEILEAVRGFRKMLSVEQDPPVDEVLEAGALPHLVRFLTVTDNPMLTFEAAWALTNIASTVRTRDVVDAGSVPHLVRLLKHERPELREQAAWCLGNVAGDCSELRDYVLQHGAMEGLILNMKEPETKSLLNNVTWAVSNLCRGKPCPSLDIVLPAIQPLADLLHREVPQEVVVDAVWALSYLADGENDRIEKVMEANVTHRLVQFLATGSSPSLTTPTVRCLGNFVTGDDHQTQAVIDAGVMAHALKLLDHPSKNIRKETCWLLSNIAAGTVHQIGSLFDEPQLLQKVVSLAKDSRWEVRREAIWVISNVFTTGSANHVQALVRLEGMDAISLALTVKDTKVLNVALEAVERILNVGVAENMDYNSLLEECQGVDRLEDLQEHPNENIYLKCVDILENFFGIEEEENENLAPEALGDTFGFGIPSKQLFPSENNDVVNAQPPRLTFNFGESMGNNYNNVGMGEINYNNYM